MLMLQCCCMLYLRVLIEFACSVIKIYQQMMISFAGKSACLMQTVQLLTWSAYLLEITL